MDKSVNLFERAVKEKHSILLQDGNEVFQMLVNDGIEKKKAAAEKMLQTATALRAYFAPEDVPQWLSSLFSHLTAFAIGRSTPEDFLTNLIPLRAQAEMHKWGDAMNTGAIDFDDIFEQFKKESRLLELFDELIRLLDEIQASGEIDSITMINALSKVTATIKKGKVGSFFSMNAAWEFLVIFLKNYVLEEFSNMPIVGPALKALEKTILETQEELSKVREQTTEKMVSIAMTELKLKEKPAIAYFTYDQKGATALIPSTPLLPNLAV